jgi:hypothetical protein
MCAASILLKINENTVDDDEQQNILTPKTKIK